MSGVEASDVARVLAAALRRPELASLDPDAQLHGPGGLGLSSMQVLEGILAVEEEFSISIGDDEIRALNSTRAIAAYLRENRPGATR